MKSAVIDEMTMAYGNRKKKYGYQYKDVATLELENLPERIYVYNLKPFENNLFNKYYAMMLRGLHPQFNVVCVHNGNRLIPINNREALKIYLGNLTYNTFRRFINEMKDKNVLIVISACEEKEYYMINPAYASDRTHPFHTTVKMFSFFNEFSRIVKVNINQDGNLADGKVNLDEYEGDKNG